MLQDEAFDAQLDHRNIEIDQKAEPKAGQLQICQHLRLEDWRHFVDRLQLDQNPIFRDQITTQPNIQPDPVVSERQRALGHEYQTPLPELLAEARLIH